MAVADLVEILRAEREDIVPLIGAGLCVEAGLPSGSALAQALRERSGLSSEVPAGNFGAVCGEIERLADLRTLQDLAAEAIASAELTPTPSLMAISGCPSARVLTTNYDRAIERSVEEIGKEPVRISMAEDLVGRRPQEGQVFVIHLHGVTERPETMVLTTTQRRALLDDENFRTRLRSLLLDGRLLALRLRLSAEEPHLRAELGRLGRLLGGPRPLVVLPDSEVDEEIGILADDADIELYRCDLAQDYLEVRQCAQLLAPRQIDGPDGRIRVRIEGRGVRDGAEPPRTPGRRIARAERQRGPWRRRRFLSGSGRQPAKARSDGTRLHPASVAKRSSFCFSGQLARI
jgi:hypothetical protein